MGGERHSEQFVALPTTFYLSGLDAYVRQNVKCYEAFFTAPSTPVPLVRPGTEGTLEEALLDVAESLMLGDGIALSVAGENTALAYMVQLFGAEPTIELMKRRAIEFVGEASLPMYSVNPSQIRYADGSPVPPGSPPLMVRMDFKSKEGHAYNNRGLDAEASATLSLRRYAGALRLDRRDIRELARRAAKRTHVEPIERLGAIQSRISSAYVAGELAALGLSPKISQDTNTYPDEALFRLAARVQRVEILLDFELDQYQMPEQWADIHRFTEEATSGQDVLRSVDRIFELRRAPHLRSLFRDGVLRMHDVPRLRNHPATESFRRWLWEKPDPRDAERITEEFVREIACVDKSVAQKYIERVATVATVIIAQDRVLDSLALPPEQRIIADVGLGVAQLVAGDVIKKYRRRPPSGFFDQVIEKEMHDAAQNAQSERTSRK